MGVRELLESTDADELTEWAAYYRIEPWGEERADHRAALIAFMVYSMLKSKEAPRRTLRDFLLEFGEERTSRTPEQIMDVLRAMTAASGGVIHG